MAYPQTTLLHISDVHFGTDHGFSEGDKTTVDRGLGTLLSHLVSDFNSLGVQHPDLLVISGDLTSTAHRSEFDTAEQFISSLLEHFSLETSRLVCIPGNHDVLWNKDTLGATRSEWDSFASRLYNVPVKDVDLRIATHGDVLVLGLDATRLESPQAGGVGFVGRDQLKRAEERLAKLGADIPNTKILAVHHHLLPVTWIEPPPTGYPRSITLDAPTILAWAQQHGFSAVLHGHQHQHFLCTFHFPELPNGPLVVSGAPSLGAKQMALPPNGRNGYTLITLADGELDVSVRRLNEAFVFEASETTTFVLSRGRAFAKSSLPGHFAIRELSTDETRRQCLAALNTITDILKSCYGPGGGVRSIRGDTEHVRDGERILESVSLDTPTQQRVVQSLRLLTKDVGIHFGDGRKTACLLCAEMARSGLQAILEGADDNGVGNSLLSLATNVRHFLMKQARMISDRAELLSVVQTAMCDRDRFAETVTEAFEICGRDGAIAVEGEPADVEDVVLLTESRSCFEVTVPEWLENLRSASSKLTAPLIAVVRHSLPLETLIHLMEHAHAINRPLVLFCDSLVENAAELITLNSERNELLMIAVTPRAFGEKYVRDDFRDIAIACGASLFDESHPLKRGKCTSDMFGTAREVCLEGSRLCLTEPNGDPETVSEHILSLRERRDAALSPYDVERLSERIARLGGATATLIAKGPSESQRLILKGLLSDGINSARQAVIGGIAPGSGETLSRCVDALNDFSAENKEATAAMKAALSLQEVLLQVARDKRRFEPVLTMAGIVTHATDVASRLIRTRTWAMGTETQ